MFVIGGILSQISISLVMAIIVTLIMLLVVMFAVTPLMAIENNIIQVIAGIIFFGLPTATFIIVFFLSLSTDYS
ncbi:hypothetical protein AWC37_04525 [Staphylococcus xylosus]|uniref:hypothetical protein n=1 Tax=Staphylococcus xylosus TaxID=1288 RepID=UPI0009BD2454|nr:hypothetical protein [Staphylococcus xylosus]ARD74428.1 hypothetical protein AWC37_04525 [Staphylococcus xylosus]